MSIVTRRGGVAGAQHPPAHVAGPSPSSYAVRRAPRARLPHPLRRAAAVLALLALLPAARPLRGQALDDGSMLPGRVLRTGVVVTHESWDRYWEGGLRRSNDNIGRFSAQSATWIAGYGASARLTLLALLPYVRTRTSNGTLREMQGVQDVTVAAKYRVLAVPVAGGATASVLVAGAVGVPVGDYSPDFLPLSIGLGSRRASGRLTASVQAERGWSASASAAYTWRGAVKLDRSTYYTDGELHTTNEVPMPSVFDYTVGAGYRTGRLQVPVSVTAQRTLGGGDIRRQDMPFVSNRMNFVRVQGAVVYTLPAPALSVQLGAGRVVSGRNVGQSTAFSGGFLYTLPF